MTTPGPRRYTMAARADAVARTRQQIVVAAAGLVRGSARPLSLTEVAQVARVSRTTIYRHFPTVGDLLDAVAAGLLARADFSALLQAVELPDPVYALRQVIVAGTRIWATDPKLVRGLLWLAHAQPDAIPVIRRLDSGREAIMERLVQRLHDDGSLRHGLHPSRAVDILVAATAFEGWDQLVTTRHRSPASASEVIAELALTAIMAPRNQGGSVARTSQSARR